MKKFLAVIALFISISTLAQQGSSSPYSFYGIGSLKFKGTVENQSMGGISVFNDSIHVNLRNPAGYAGQNLKSFNDEGRPIKYTVGGSQSQINLKGVSASESSSTSSLDYLAIAIPLGKFGAGFGLLPYSSVGYKLQSFSSEETLQYKYRGEGGINKVFLGLGYQLSNNIRIGVDASYNFGNITNTNIAFGYNEQGEFLQYHTREVNRSDLGGISYNFGIIYTKLLKSNLQFTASGSYAPSTNLKSKNQRNFSTVVVNLDTEQEVALNTIDVDLSEIGLETTDLKIPSKTSIGFGFGTPRKWFAGVDYTFLKASQFSNRLIVVDNSTYEDASTISVGGFYIPEFDSFNKYWKRIVYRTGIRFENTGLKVNNQVIKEFGISFGVGLPVGRIFSNANIGLELGKRGTTNANLVEENFVNFQLSLSLNDRWFEKLRFN
ncbi:MAG: hypothetical protein HON66_06590 [Formosa sp.]|jgi:hypothetical protein|nr:hypothetical protein [Formosa sp.]|tara:strand:- start:3585 stop:4889 length:1305 start_codon:yes stop_codon:yes gene_type:complete